MKQSVFIKRYSIKMWKTSNNKHTYIFGTSLILLSTLIFIKQYTAIQYGVNILSDSVTTMPGYVKTYKAFWGNNISTSFNHSEFYLKSIRNGRVEVIIQAYTSQNVKKELGGDIFLIRAERMVTGELCSGRVSDNLNGTYTGLINIPWTGDTGIYIKLGSVAESSFLLESARTRYGNSAFAVNHWGINAEFRGPRHKESTVCGIMPHLQGYMDNVHSRLDTAEKEKRHCNTNTTSDNCLNGIERNSSENYMYSQICNYTARNDGNAWFCGKPINFECDEIYEFDIHTYNVERISEDEIVKIEGNGQLRGHLPVLVEKSNLEKADTLCRHIERYKTWTRDISSGFWNKTWNPLICKVLTKHTESYYRGCLNGKNIAFFGDSSIRQIVEYFTENVLQLGKVDIRHQYGHKRSFHPDIVFKGHNISVIYRKHALPYINDHVRPNNIKDVPRMLREIADSEISGENIIVVINCYLHFIHFQPSEYRLRLSKIVKAIKYLVKTKPGISGNIFFKGAYFTNSVGWFEGKSLLLFRDIQFEEFHDVMNDVVYLDVWDITVSHNSQVIHPEGSTFLSQIQQLMGYICK